MDFITSIDIGTTKICVLIGRILSNNQIEILGIGKAPSDGLHKGVVVDISKTIYSITNAIKEAEIMANISIESAYIGISGGHIQSRNSHGVVPIKRGIIRKNDIMYALAAAQAIPIPEGLQILHVLPQYFIIDGQEKVHDPIGMHGIRLEVQTHIILGAVTSVQNLVKCCEQAGIQINDVILEQLASADAVLSNDECDLGVAVLDIGGGTSDLAIYQQGSIRHTMVLPVAGNHFTQDLAIGLRITRNEAERIKKKYGVVYPTLFERDELIEVEMVQGCDRQIIQRTDLIRILQPRAQELLSLVHEEIITHNLIPVITTGMVLTGGGSLLVGMQESAEQLFDMPIRIGKPQILFDLPETLRNPIYATGYGLIVHALKKRQKKTPFISQASFSKRIIERMKSWVSDFF
ncbi:MAG: cell division protein FtsA [Candidatus Babeliales bacterium]